MDAYFSKGNHYLPNINLDPKGNKFEIRGKSLPYDTESFFDELIEWAEKYAENPNQSTKLEINLESLNGKSIRKLLAVLNALKKASSNGGKLEVDWIVPSEDEDLAELGGELMQTVDVPFNICYN